MQEAGTVFSIVGRVTDRLIEQEKLTPAEADHLWWALRNCPGLTPAEAFGSSERLVCKPLLHRLL